MATAMSPNGCTFTDDTDTVTVCEGSPGSTNAAWTYILFRPIASTITVLTASSTGGLAAGSSAGLPPTAWKLTSSVSRAQKRKAGAGAAFTQWPRWGSFEGGVEVGLQVARETPSSATSPQRR